MEYAEVAQRVVGALGGAQNVAVAATCLTRLRLTLKDVTAVDSEALRAIKGVLGLAVRGGNGIEVVFGPASIEGVAQAFAAETGLQLTNQPEGATSALEAVRERASKDDTERRPERDLENGGTRIRIPAGRKRSYRAQQHAAIDDERLGSEDIAALKDFLAEDGTSDERVRVRLGGTRTKLGRSVLVINGPNINMLGLREPDIYGRQDYNALVRTCRDAARKAGFADVRCFQSNHEGAIVDEIQGALGSYDGIVINPAAYTHTSVAILDAVKAVGLPCVEVHISKVEEREDFRQVSYVRAACFETITGMGLDGYRKAIFDLAAHLDM